MAPLSMSAREEGTGSAARTGEYESAEEVGVDDQGNIFAGFTASGKMALRKFVKN